MVGVDGHADGHGDLWQLRATGVGPRSTRRRGSEGARRWPWRRRDRCWRGITNSFTTEMPTASLARTPAVIVARRRRPGHGRRRGDRECRGVHPQQVKRSLGCGRRRVGIGGTLRGVGHGHGIRGSAGQFELTVVDPGEECLPLVGPEHEYWPGALVFGVAHRDVTVVQECDLNAASAVAASVGTGPPSSAGRVDQGHPAPPLSHQPISFDTLASSLSESRGLRAAALRWSKTSVYVSVSAGRSR